MAREDHVRIVYSDAQVFIQPIYNCVAPENILIRYPLKLFPLHTNAKSSPYCPVDGETSKL